MTDNLTPAERSDMMSRIRGSNTTPEIAVRRWLHACGYRFRLHRRDLPGRPDIVLPSLQTVILVHGCYWHRHKDCRLAYTPKSNVEKWQTKFDENVERDRRDRIALQRLGWRVVVIWECQVRSGAFPSALEAAGFLDKRRPKS